MSMGESKIYGALDPHGDHASICSGTFGLSHRHNRIRDFFVALFRSAGFSCKSEVEGLLGPTKDRPADILVEDWNGSYRATCFDVSVVSPVCDSNRIASSNTPGIAVKNAEKKKFDKYLKVCNEKGLGLYPLLFSSFGSPSDRVNSVLDRIAHMTHEKDNIPFSVALMRIRQKLSVVYQKSLYDMFAHRML